tara:strand:+ start:48 stop:524 length:477 start_codon:yes stop_codon:yes gene_type:complete
MSRIKVDALQGTSGSDTAITLSGANATVGGTLSVTGVHTVGNNALFQSDGSAVTQNLVQGLLKAWGNLDGSGTVGNNDSFNMSTVTDRGTGLYTSNMTNNFSSGNACMSGYSIMDGLVYGESGQVSNTDSFQYRVVVGHSNSAMDPDEMHTIHAGDLA